MRWNGQHALPSPLISPAAHHMRLQLDQAELERKAGSAALTQAEAELSRSRSGNRAGPPAVLESQQAVTEEARGRFARAERAVALSQNSLSYARLTADATLGALRPNCSI
jgi:hypothetical protein